MKASLRSNAPWIAGGMTLVLSIGFLTPIGSERMGGTAYQRFDNVLVRFMDVEVSSGASAASQPPAERSPLALLAAASPVRPTSTATPKRAPKPSRSARGSAPRPMHPSVPEPVVLVSSAPSPIEGIPQPIAPRQPQLVPMESYSADLIRDAFEAEPSKLLLDTKASGDKVLLRLVGICRWQGHYIVKVSVTNQTAADFFIKELSAYAGPEFITLKSYFRLFVEPGRTREGHIVFDPQPGAKVKVTLKEDREKGRVIEAPVPYPF